MNLAEAQAFAALVHSSRQMSARLKAMGQHDFTPTIDTALEVLSEPVVIARQLLIAKQDRAKKVADEAARAQKEGEDAALLRKMNPANWPLAPEDVQPPLTPIAPFPAADVSIWIDPEHRAPAHPDEVLPSGFQEITSVPVTLDSADDVQEGTAAG